jgi:hypothetical protein
MRKLKMIIISAVLVLAVSCGEKKDKTGEDKSAREDKSMPSVEQENSDMVDEGYESEKSEEDGEPVPGAEIYLEQEPAGEE